MLLTLYDRYGNVKTTLSPDDSSRQVKEIQGDNMLTLTFTLYEYLNIDVNDYVDYLGERYWAKEKFLPNEKSAMEWSYNVKLYGIESLLARFLVLKTVDGDVDPVFALTGRPIEHMRLIVANINAGMGSSDWNVGTVEGTENVVIDYTGKYCDEALKELAEAVGTEWWVEGNTVNLCRCEHGEEVTLSYGHGLASLDRDVADNAKFYTRLFPIGSSKNIDPAQYGHSRLQLPNGAKYVDVDVEQYGVIHHYEEKAFDGIYPHRIGKVSSVRHENAVDKDGRPFTIYYFKDDDLTFDPNDYEIGGLVKHVSFLDGSELSGLGIGDDHYFEVNYHSDTQEFEIITIWPYDDDTQLPGGQLVPAIDNEYILWNIRMPEEYYGMAEQEFKRAVDAYNAEHALDVSVYKAPTDHVWVEEQEAALPQDEDALLYVGRRVRLESDEYFPNTGYRSSRITRISRQVTLPSLMDLDISDALSRGTLEKIDDSIHDVKNYTDRMLKDANVPYIIKSWETIPPTDNNLFSARRVVKQFLDKLTTAVQEVWGRIIFKQKIIVEDDASVENSLEVGEELSVDRISSNEEDSVCVDDNLNVTGDTNMEGDAQIGGNTQQVGDLTFGSTDTNANTHYVQGVKGAKIYWNGSGWFVETDYLAVNKRMYAKSIQVDEVTHVGGENLLTEASCVADSVKEYSTFYRVFFRRKNGEGRTIFNQFRVGDQAYCQIFNIDAGESEGFTNRYYWRLVVNTSNNTSASYDEETVTLMENFHFIDLSKSISDVSGDLRMDDHAGSVPKAEDPIVQLGYRRQAGDDDELVAERQGATLISGGGKYKRAIVMWEGINSFVLPNPRIFFSPNRVDMVVDSLKIRTAGTDKPVEQYVDDNQEQFEIFETGTNDIPTLNNEPYTSWSAAEKELYSTEPNNAVVLNSEGRTWRFVWNGNTYAFEEFTDPWLLAQHKELKNILDDGVITQDEIPQLQLTCNTIISQCQKVINEYGTSNANAPDSPLYTPYQNYINSYNVLCSSTQGNYGYFYEISGMTPPIYLHNYAGTDVTKYRASRSDILGAIITNALRYDEWNKAYTEWKAVQIAHSEADDALTLAMEYVDEAIADIDASTIDAQLANLINAYKNGNLATHSQLEATDQRVTAVTNWVGTDSTSFGSTGLLTHLRNLFVGTSSVVLDTEGYITNISKAGLVTSEQFAALGARVATAEGNIVSAATIAAWISDSFDNNSNAAKLKSHILITADDVKIESGNKSMGDYFSLMNGNLWCQNLTVAGVYNNLIDVIDWANGIGKDKIIIAYFSGTDGDGDVLAYSNSLGSIVDADSGEIVEPATLNYGSIRCYLDVMNCGDVLVIKSLPSVLQLNSDDQDGMLRLPFFIDSGIQERTYTRFNDSGIHLITPDELRMMVGKKMVIRTTINDTLYQQTFLKGQYHLTALDASARAIQTLVNGLPFYLDRPIGNNGEIRPDLVMADQRLNGPKTLFLEMKLCEFFSDTSITQASRKYGYAWCGQESYAGSALGEDIDVAWNN